MELEQLGIVDLLHHRGAVVRPFGPKEVQDFYAVRGLLECEAVRLACPHIDPKPLHECECELDRFRGPRWLRQVVEEFSHSITASIASSWTTATIGG